MDGKDMSDSNIIIIGLSGPSSSGKTTIARLLRDIFNIATDTTNISLFIVHEDDFYKTDIDVPWRTWTSPVHGDRRLQDWDCVESLDLPLMQRVLSHVKRNGVLPADFASKEDQNSVGDMHVSREDIESRRREIQEQLAENDAVTHTATASSTGGKPTTTPATDANNQQKREIKICILEGFLLFPPPPSTSSSTSDSTSISTSTSTSSPQSDRTQPTQLNNILSPILNLKLFLPSTRELTINRRAKRSGYVTLEGFWEDPPGYVEELVWPNYVRDQGWLFSSSADVDEAKVDFDTARKNHILVGPGRGDGGIRIVLDWGVDVLRREILRRL